MRSCGDRLLTNARGYRENPHIDRFVQRKMRGVFDIGIFDEVHELAAAETIQGNTFGTLASSCRYAVALTGTLIGGKRVICTLNLANGRGELMKVRGLTSTASKVQEFCHRA